MTEKISLENVLKAVSTVTGVEAVDIMGHRCITPFPDARHLCWILLYENGWSYQGIAEAFSRPNHSTILLSSAKKRGVMEVDKDLDYKYKAAKVLLSGIALEGKVYVAGKVSGLPASEVIAKFDDATLSLMKLGHNVVNPTRLVEVDAHWSYAMRICLRALVECTHIYLLPDWKDSPGARLEVEVARKLEVEFLNPEML